MAGIGFELKKIFKKESISRFAGGVAYSTLVTVGPTIMVIVTVILLYAFLGLTSVPYTERELLSSTILYVFIFSLLTTAGFNGVMSRYIADKIFEQKYDDILPSFYTGIFLNTLIGAVLGVPFILRGIFIGKIDLMFSFVSYCFFIAMIITFYSMIYLSATKDYKIIAIYYAIGMTVGFILANLFHKFGLTTIKSILYGITLGFLTIAFLEFAYMRKYFNSNSRNYKDCLHYFVDHKNIYFCNFFYILGLYIHNFVFWTHPSHIIIAKSYVSMQSYDMASCLAMFTNISIVILFTVMAETKFHDKYQMYNEAVIGKTLNDINRSKTSMFRLLIQQIGYLVGIQAIMTIIIFLMAIIILPILGFGGSVLDIYPSLVIAYFTIFLMYSNIIFMFYFNDNTGAMLISIIFCISTLIGSIFSIKLSEAFYGLGAFFGGFIGWSFSYFRIQYLEKHFDEHIFCRTNILKKVVGEMPDSKVYVNYFRDNTESKVIKNYNEEDKLNLNKIYIPAELKQVFTDIASPQFLGETIIIKAIPEGEVKTLYRFKIEGEISEDSGYIEDNIYQWNSKKEGNYKITVMVKNEAMQGIEYEDIEHFEYEIVNPKCSGEYLAQILAKSLKSTEKYDCNREIIHRIPIKIKSDNNEFYVNESMNFYVECDEEKDIYFEFYLMEKGEWRKIQKYSKKSFYSFIPFSEGEYKILVFAKGNHKNISYEAYDMLTFNTKIKTSSSILY